MSIQTFLATVETDIEKDVEWVEGKTETALTAIWNVVKPAFLAFEPTVVQGVLGAIATFLSTAETSLLNGGNLADLETALLNDLEAEASVLLDDAKSLGSDILQALIGLAKAAHV